MKTIPAMLVLGVLLFCQSAFADDFAPASWSVPAAKDVKFELDTWLKGKTLSETQQAQIDALWPAETTATSEPAASDLLEQTVATIAVVEPLAKEIAQFCRASTAATVVPQWPILTDNSKPPVVANNLRLLVGAWLSQHDMHEEALVQFGSLTPNDVVDPATLLFHRSVCFHRLRDKEQCLPALATLLENEATLPRRYRDIAKLMQADMEPLKPDSLDEVARLMDSIRRRLDLGRVGGRVRQEEDDVISKLDKMINDLESQRQQQQQQAAASSQSGKSPATPLPDSQNVGGRGPGNVDPKKLADGGTWDRMPPKNRQEALQQISKELPAHYREAIEEYFRKIAREGEK